MIHDVPADIKSLGPEFADLYRALPPFPTRADIAQQLPLLTRCAMSGLDFRKQGPAGRLRVGKQVCYPRTEFVRWFAGKAAGNGGGKQ